MSMTRNHVYSAHNALALGHFDLLNGTEGKWPLPYALMFMVTVSLLLWLAIISGASTLWSIVT